MIHSSGGKSSSKIFISLMHFKKAIQRVRADKGDS
jgi:hypothetical protein